MPIFCSIAVYKALYKSFGGFAADVVAAIDQVCMTGSIYFFYQSLVLELIFVQGGSAM